MRLVNANGKRLLLTDSGEVHAPGTLFLNSRYDNPNTHSTVALGLRLLEVFLRSFDISLPRRALDGQCLHTLEVGWLGNLSYRPVEELESMNTRMLVRLAKSQNVAHRDRPGAVAASTASARLVQIGEFLTWYFENILTPRITSPQARTDLYERYAATVRELKKKIRGGNSKHPTQVRSLPTEVFVQLIREVWCRPETIFCSESGATSPTVMRDRAMFLLACEGMRPGAIGNLALQDFTGFQMRIVDNAGKRGKGLSEGTPVQKGARSNMQAYSSEHNITLWPWTTAAIHEYIQGERAELLNRRLHNPSKGFLFLENQYGGPISNRRTISLIFERAERRLLELGFLSRPSGDRYIKTEDYKLTAYNLRHSAATLYISIKGDSEQTRSEMKERFGWSANSKMPEHYARRAKMDAASLDLADLWESIKADRLKMREEIECA
jgi:integrase